jgi:hypothetical protein
MHISIGGTAVSMISANQELNDSRFARILSLPAGQQTIYGLLLLVALWLGKKIADRAADKLLGSILPDK